MDEVMRLAIEARNNTHNAFRQIATSATSTGSAVSAANRTAGQSSTTASAAIRQAATNIQQSGALITAAASATSQAWEAARGQVSQAAGGIKDAIAGTGGGGGGGISGAFKMAANAASMAAGPFKIAFAALQIGGDVLGSITGALGSVASAAIGAAKAIGGALWDAASRLFDYLKTGAAIGLTALAAGMAFIAKTGVDMNVTLDASQIALTKMSGSSENAAALIAGLRKEARTSMLTFKEMLPTAQGLVGVLGPQGLGNVIPIMRAFGDAATALQVDPAGMSLALRGFRQMIGKPFAQQEEVNQIDENLPGANVAGILKKRFGSSSTEDLKAANVSGKQVGFAIIAGLQEAFGGSQEALGGSLPMLLSGIKDTMNDLSATVTTGLTAKLKEAASGLLDFMNGLSASTAGGKLLEMISGGLNAAGDAAIHLVGQLPRVAEWITKVSDGVPWTRMRDVALNALDMIRTGAMNAGAWLMQNWPRIWQMVSGAVDQSVMIVGGVISGAAAVIRDFASGGNTDLSNFLGGLKSFAAGAVELFGMVGGAVAGLTGYYATMWKTITAGLAVVSGGKVREFFTGQSQMFGAVADASGKAMIGLPTAGFAAGKAIRQGINFDAMVSQGSQAGGSVGKFFGGYADFQQRYRQQGLGAIGLGGLTATRAGAGQRWGLGAGAMAGGSGTAAISGGVDVGSGMGGAGGGGEAGAAATSSKEAAKAVEKESKRVKEAIDLRNSYYSAWREMAKAQSDAAGEGQKHASEAAAMIPVITAQIRDVTIPQLRYYKAGTEEHGKALKEYWQLAAEAGTLQQRAVKEAVDAAKKAGDEQRKLADAQHDYMEAQIKNDPRLSKRQKSQGSILAQIQRFNALQQPIEGETDEQRMRRMTEASNVGGGIYEKMRELGIQPGAFGAPKKPVGMWRKPEAEWNIFSERLGSTDPNVSVTGGFGETYFGPTLQSNDDFIAERQGKMYDKLGYSATDMQGRPITLNVITQPDHQAMFQSPDFLSRFQSLIAEFESQWQNRAWGHGGG